MANNRFQFKRTSTSGLLPNTTNSANNSYIAAGEFAVNLTDKKVVSSNGTATFEVGANVSNLNVTGALIANGSNGSSGQFLTSNGTGIYWSTSGGSRAAGVGLSSNDTHYFLLANTGIIANATGTFVNSAYISTLDANNATYLGGSSLATIQDQITGNSATAYSNATLYADTKASTAYSNAITYSSNATNLTSGTVNPARLGSGTANSTTVLYGNGVWATPTGSSVPANTILSTGTGSNQSFVLSTSTATSNDLIVTVNGLRYSPNNYQVTGSTLYLTAPANSEIVIQLAGGPTGATGIAGANGTSISNVVSNKVGGTTTVTINGDFAGAPTVLTILDGANGTAIVNTAESYTWTNNHTFNANVSANNVEINTTKINQSLSVGNTTSNAVINSTAIVTTSNTVTIGNSIYVSSTGNLGVGYVDPPYKLLVSDGTITMAFAPLSGLGYFGTITNHPLLFATNSTERLTISGTGSITSSDLADAVGYKGIPQNSKSAQYTLALSDMGKHIDITTGGVVIPANGTVAFPIGATIVIFNDSASTQTITITTDTLRLAGTTTTGTRTIAAYGVATLLKVAATVWVVSGNVT